MAQSIELTPESSIDLLIRYTNIGYKTGSMSIKDGATVCQYFRILKNQEEPTDSTVTKEKIYQILFSVLDSFNTKGAFTLDDSSVLDKVSTYIKENILSKKPIVSEPKIKEI